MFPFMEPLILPNSFTLYKKHFMVIKDYVLLMQILVQYKYKTDTFRPSRC